MFSEPHDMPAGAEPPEPPPPPRRPPLGRKILFSLAFLLVPLVLVEIGLRLAGVTFYPDAITLTAEEDTHPLNVSFVENDPEVGWVLTPGVSAGAVTINEQGVRGDPCPLPKPPGAVRILCLGDSCTFAARVARPYPALLQDRLRQAFPSAQIDVINGGVPGHAANQGLAMLGRDQVYEPDIVTLYYGWNDHWRKSKAMMIAKPPITDRVLILRGLRLLYARWEAQRAVARLEDRYYMGSSDLRVPPAHYRAALEEFANRSHSEKFDLVFLTAPAAFNQANLTRMVEELGWAARAEDVPARHAHYNDISREVAAEHGDPLVDLVPLFRDSSEQALIHVDGIHPNQRGHELIAEALFSAVKPLVEARLAESD